MDKRTAARLVEQINRDPAYEAHGPVPHGRGWAVRVQLRSVVRQVAEPILLTDPAHWRPKKLPKGRY